MTVLQQTLLPYFGFVRSFFLMAYLHHGCVFVSNDVKTQVYCCWQSSTKHRGRSLNVTLKLFSMIPSVSGTCCPDIGWNQMHIWIIHNFLKSQIFLSPVTGAVFLPFLSVKTSSDNMVAYRKQCHSILLKDFERDNTQVLLSVAKEDC